ncbi:MAG TPA: Uma2 family endonuclease [Polyangiaceae bacterium]
MCLRLAPSPVLEIAPDLPMSSYQETDFGAHANLCAVAMARPPYVIDPADPRAPSEAIWQAMTETERASVLEQLPSEVLRETEPEGDPHRDPKEKAVEALREYFRNTGRRVYLSAELPVYYPGERLFAPDVIAVLDVDPHPRNSWVVSHEGRGLDFALEVTLAGDRKKDLEDNVVRFAQLGIDEYFVLDLKLERVLGFRLDGSGNYAPIPPQSGHLVSHVLGLDLAFELGRVRFYAGSTPLPFADELIARLDSMLVELVSKEHSLAQQLQAMTALAEQERAKAQVERIIAEQEKSRAEREKSRAEQAQTHAEQEKLKYERLAQRLRDLGVDPDSE